MEKLTIESLKANTQEFALIIRSLSNCLYRAEITIAGVSYLLVNPQGGSTSFFSTESIKTLLTTNAVYPKQVLLHQNTTYGEMIGMSQSTPEAMLLPLHW